VAAGGVRQLEWLPGARMAFHDLVAQILLNDLRATELVRARSVTESARRIAKVLPPSRA
jgi:hypothetical protein